jgi:foldase protein PrsA
MNKLSRFLALGAFFVAMAVALTACGGSDNSIPGNAVVKVGSDSILKSTFDHWMNVAAISSAGQTEADKAKAASLVPDAPAFTKCIAEKKASAPKPAKGQPKPTDATSRRSASSSTTASSSRCCSS